MKRTDDMFFWYNNPPYVRYWAKFTSEAAQLDEKEKAEKNSLPEHRRKLNEWKFMGARGRIYSEFKGGVKKPYNYQEKFENRLKFSQKWHYSNGAILTQTLIVTMTKWIVMIKLHTANIFYSKMGKELEPVGVLFSRIEILARK